MKYRKRPVVIEAVEVGLAREGHSFCAEMPNWLYDAFLAKTVERNAEGNFAVKTLEGTMTASPGDFIIQGVQGEIYFCKPDIFAKTYERLDEVLQCR